MTKNASEVQTIVDMSQANIAAKRDLRYVIRDRIQPLIACLDALGDDPDLCAENEDEDRSQVQHVDLAVFYEQVGEANKLLCQAYSILADMHNDQTALAVNSGFVMDAPNGGGGR